jgi:hypothetical protein
MKSWIFSFIAAGVLQVCVYLLMSVLRNKREDRQP